MSKSQIAGSKRNNQDIYHTCIKCGDKIECGQGKGKCRDDYFCSEKCRNIDGADFID